MDEEKKIDAATHEELIQKLKEPVEEQQSDLDSLPLDLKFELLLHRKVCDKSTTQRTSMRKYYRDIYNRTGIIPEGIFHSEGRKVSGRKGTLPQEVEKKFIEMIKAAVADINDAGFITKNLRKVVNFHRRLEDKFGDIPIDALYRLVHKHGLKKYLEKPDYDDDKQNKILASFQSLPVFDLIQIDGCQFHYVEIRDENGHWARPHAIEFLDTGSRYMFMLEIYFSESNGNTVEAFAQFLRSTQFPKKTIGLRPDQAKGFLNLKRPVHELNLKYSYPGQFYFAQDFARVRKAKDKPHLESSHRRLHGFEDFIISKLPPEKLSERIPGVKIKTQSGRIEIVTITRFDITLDQLRATGLHQKYRSEHNERPHTFSEAGRQAKWRPVEKMQPYLDSVPTFKFKEEDIEDCLKYGFRKEKATVSPSGKIRFKKFDYQVMIGDFSGISKIINVKVSEYKNKLYIFEPDEKGLCIGEAIRISEYKEPEHVQKVKEKKLKQNEFEQLVAYLERCGMTIRKIQLERLLELYKQGLKPEIAVAIIAMHKSTYDNYLNNFDKSQVGIILCNLFFTHVTEYLRNHGASLK